MSRTTDRTSSCSLVQPPACLIDDWSEHILPRLPADLDQQARTHKAFLRARAFACPADMLRGLLSYALSQASFRQLGAWALLSDLADISAKSWRECLLRASPWLDWLLTHLLSQQRPPRLLNQRLRGRLLLIDATMLARKAGAGAGWRVHTAYDLLAGRIAQVAVTTHFGAESLLHYQLRAGDLLVTDAGYSSRAAVAVAQAAGADTITRIHLNSFPLEHADGQPFDALAFLQRAGPLQRSCVVWCTARRVVEGEQVVTRHRLRLLAQRLPAPQRASAERQLRRKASKHGRQVSERGLFLASWSILVTTLESEGWSEEEVWELYQARWQVELLFKRIKQQVQVHTLRCTKEEVATASIRALLVGWVLVEDVAVELQAKLQRQAQAAPSTLPGQVPTAEAVVSIWGVSGLVLTTLRQILLRPWSVRRLEECLPRLQRYLVSHPRQRGHQASQVVAWLSGVIWTPPRARQWAA